MNATEYVTMSGAEYAQILTTIQDMYVDHFISSRDKPTSDDELIVLRAFFLEIVSHLMHRGAIDQDFMMYAAEETLGIMPGLMEEVFVMTEPQFH